MSIEYRTVRADEVPAATDVFLSTLADLARRNGMPPPTSFTHAAIEPIYAHIRETGIFDVAESDGRIVAICNGIVRDEIGFLSMFWTLPEFQLRGIGRPLLDRVFDAARRRGARVFCTWSSIDYAAIGTYLKLGMLPGGPIFVFAGPVQRELEPALGVTLNALEPAQAAAIDRTVRGTAREPEHAFWQRRGVPGFQLERAGRVLGYFYSTDGVIGPAAWLARDDGPAVLSAALHVAGTQADVVKLMTIGTNEAAIRAATRAGLRVAGASHWLRSAPFGILDQYLTSGPALF
jgi:GNAT superfamily N-acetyltransferase